MKKQKSPTSEKVKEIIEKTLDDKKAIDISSISLKGKSDIADYMIIASGTSGAHVTALAKMIIDALKENDIDVISSEGWESAQWILIDTPYVIIHIFQQKTREYYNLEKMWADDCTIVD